MSSVSQGAVARGDADEVLEVALALRVVVGVDALEQWVVVAQDLGQLLVGPASGLDEAPEQARQGAQLGGMGAPAGGLEGRGHVGFTGQA